MTLHEVDAWVTMRCAVSRVEIVGVASAETSGTGQSMHMRGDSKQRASATRAQRLEDVT
jgi:hypothetical protein